MVDIIDDNQKSDLVLLHEVMNQYSISGWKDSLNEIEFSFKVYMNSGLGYQVRLLDERGVVNLSTSVYSNSYKETRLTAKWMYKDEYKPMVELWLM